MSREEFFRKCDDTSNLPPLAAENYDFELNWLVRNLPEAPTLQIGSHDGRRAVSLLSRRPDIIRPPSYFWGLEIERGYVEKATRLLKEARLLATFVEGDAANPPDDLPPFDRAICLNNTLSYIPDYIRAIEQMRRLAKVAVVSVFGETFDETEARAYFEAIGSEVTGVETQQFLLGDFAVHRFTRSDVEAWDGTITETRLGYLVEMGGQE